MDVKKARVIGIGGNAKVFRKGNFAVKVYSCSDLNRGEMKHCFAKQMTNTQMSHSLDKNYVVKYYYVSNTEKTRDSKLEFRIFMEIMTGSCAAKIKKILQDMWKKDRSLAEKLFVNIARKMIKIIDHLHTQSHCNTDIKLKNFLFKLVVKNGKVICIVKMGDLESVFHRNTFVF